MEEGYSGEKTKLTLGIDKEVIKRAKASGINISAITEQILHVMTFESNEVTYDEVVKSFEKFLDEIKKILIKYDSSLEVGRIQHSDNGNEDTIIYLSRSGLTLWSDYSGISEETEVKDLGGILHHLDSPKEILPNLIQTLIKSTEKSKTKLQELKFALKFLKTLTEDDKGETR